MEGDNTDDSPEACAGKGGPGIVSLAPMACFVPRVDGEKVKKLTASP
jgi:hypothetical protein